jgi:hypothetical protein
MPTPSDYQDDPTAQAEKPSGHILIWDERKRPYILLVILGLFLSLVFFLYAQTTPQIEDSIGYIYAGERMALGHGLTYDDPNNALAGPYFSLSAFQIRRDEGSKLYLGFPPGYPVLIALGIVITGIAETAHYIVPLLSLIGVIVTFFLGKYTSGNNWVGLWAAVLIGLALTYWEFGTAAWSEIPATVLMTAGLCFFLMSHRASPSQRQIFIFSFIGGLLLGYSFYIRYANLLILPAILLYEVAAKRTQIFRDRGRWIFYGVLAGSILGILIFNNYYYGGPFLTSYSPENGRYPYAPFTVRYAFGPSFANGESAVHVVQTLWDNFPIKLLLVPAGWILLPRPSGVLAASATLGFLVLYSLYAFAPEGVNSRFLLSVFPFITVAIAQSVVSIGQRMPAKLVRRMAGILLFVLLRIPLPRRLEALESRNKASDKSAQVASEIAH